MHDPFRPKPQDCGNALSHPAEPESMQTASPYSLRGASEDSLRCRILHPLVRARVVGRVEAPSFQATDRITADLAILDERPRYVEVGPADAPPAIRRILHDSVRRRQPILRIHLSADRA